MIFDLEISPELSRLPKLKDLTLKGWGRNVNYDFLSNMTHIEKLTLIDVYTENHEKRDLFFLKDMLNLKNLIIVKSPDFLKDLSPLLTLCEDGNLEWVSVENNFIDLRKGTPNREVIDRLIEEGVEVLYEKGNRTEKNDRLFE